jgi:hypothetical protein
MEFFIRFQTPLRCEYTARRAGVFLASTKFARMANLPDFQRASLEQSIDWFNDHLTVPDLGRHGWRALFWFRGSARTAVARMWQVVNLLRDAGLRVQMQRTNDPGRIVYADDLQVAAAPYRLASRRRRAMRRRRTVRASRL